MSYREMEKDLATSGGLGLSTVPLPGLVAYKGMADKEYVPVSDADLGRFVDEVLRHRWRRNNFVEVIRDDWTWFRVSLRQGKFGASYGMAPDDGEIEMYMTDTTDVRASKRALIGWAHGRRHGARACRWTRIS